MRIGSNPEKFKKELELKVYHRVVIPVYIPHFEDYFKDAFEIFKLNINSLLATCHNKTRITLYNNNSHQDIKKFIDKIYHENDIIDQVFHSKENLGKINAILAAVKGNLEPLITIADSDVMFKHNWQKEVEKIFINFPNAGLVSPVPNSVSYKYYTANNFFDAVFGSSKLRFEKVVEPSEMQRFEDSLGPEVSLFSEKHLEKYLTLSNNGFRAVMGAGHFVATIRREVFDKGTNSPAFIKIQGGVENKFIDKPNEDLGLLRLSTMSNYAYHLGNVTEDWMFEEFQKISENKPNPFTEYSNINFLKTSTFKIKMGKIIRKILLSKMLKKNYFKMIGLNDGKNY